MLATDLNTRKVFIFYQDSLASFFSNFDQAQQQIFKDFLWLGDLDSCYQDLFKTTLSFTNSKSLLGKNIPFLIINLSLNLNLEALARAANAVSGAGILVLLLSPYQATQADQDSLRWNGNSIATPNFYKYWDSLLASLERLDNQQLVDQYYISNYLLSKSKEIKLTDQQVDLIKLLITKIKLKNNFKGLIYAKRGAGKTTTLDYLVRELKVAGLEQDIFVCSSAKQTTFSLDKSNPKLHYLAPDKIATSDLKGAIVIVDEAAQLPLTLLEQLYQINPSSLIMATTLESYEGTCLGFIYKFLKTKKDICCYTLEGSQRWGSQDSLAKFISQLTLNNSDLLMELAEPDKVIWQRYQLLASLQKHSLKQSLVAFNLLRNTHYKTKLDDLRRLLDGSNSYPYYLTLNQVHHQQLIAIIWYLEESVDYSAELKQQIVAQIRRPRGNLVLQKLAVILNDPDILEMSCLRISRISIAPEFRKQGISQILFELPTPNQLTANGKQYDFSAVIYNYHPKLESYWQSYGYQTIYLGSKNATFSNSVNTIAVKGISERWFKQMVPQLQAKGLI